MMTPRKTQSAFTLIEVLFAFGLLTVSALIVAATMPVATTSRVKANLQYKAMGLAQKQLEAIRGLGYANATVSQLYTFGLIDSATAVSTNTYSFSNGDSAARDNPSRILPTGSGTVKVEQADLDLRKITIVVNWKDRGVDKSYSLGTLIANL